MFPLYLWGIETKVSKEFQIPLGFLSFHFTYEELKQRKVLESGGKIRCFHFTYEELKPEVEFQFNGKDLPRFHFTYEELKPGLARQSNYARRCFHFTYEELKLSFLIHITLPAGVSTLPMRNWNTSVESGIRNGELPGFHFTYEELKLYWERWNNSYSGNVSTLPMRNWNISKTNHKT